MAGAKNEPGEWRRTHIAETGVVRSRNGGHDWTYCRRLDIAPGANIEAMTIAAYPGGYTLFVGDTEGMVYATMMAGQFDLCRRRACIGLERRSRQGAAR